MAITNAQLKTELDYLKESYAQCNKKQDAVLASLNGNGNKGIKDRITILETKFWIVCILLTPISGWAIKMMLWG